MATNNTFRPTRLVPMDQWEALERDLDSLARSYEWWLERQIELESGMGYYDQGNPGYSEITPIEHSPTLAVEAIFWYNLGPDDRATVADIPTVKFPPEPETIELDPLPASEWKPRAATLYALMGRMDIL